jgi:hypothetical protein
MVTHDACGFGGEALPPQVRMKPIADLDFSTSSTTWAKNPQ